MEILSLSVTVPPENFWKALKIYFDHPKSINKQVLLSECVLALQIETSLNENLSENKYNDLYETLSQRLSSQNNINQQNSDTNLKEIDCEHAFQQEGTFLLVRKLIPKKHENAGNKFYEFIFLAKKEKKIYIFTKHIQNAIVNDSLCDMVSKQQDPLVILKFRKIEINYLNNSLKLFSCDKDLGEKGVNWLKVVFVEKFAKLMSNVTKCDNKSRVFNNLIFTSKVDVLQFYKLYEEMKLKYAKFLIENWTENTDPKKFVYEDIGIATYLILLWNGGTIPEENAKKQKFVDLGCGNGLLVYILNSEGHMGVGLDMRKRKIWDMYHSKTILKEETIIPTLNTTYPEADWLIGNHSDELTAWIPVIARRSNRNCQYFVLPCCPYQLNGQKFQRKNCALSSYQDFMNYVKNISELCNFDTYIDKLRIPSTKRICLVGLNESEISENEFDLINERIIDFINEECEVSNKKKDLEEQSYLAANGKPGDQYLGFKVRESVEKVRNCTKLPQTVINEILMNVMNMLLEEKHVCTVIRNNVICEWNRGKMLPICKLAEHLSKELLKQLKEECKGLQTLLKNHHFIFEVKQGFVQFRSPESLMEISKKFFNTGNKTKWKKRSCWFYDFHPQKCPLSDDVCSYSHY